MRVRQLILAAAVFILCEAVDATFAYCTTERRPLEKEHQNECEDDRHGAVTVTASVAVLVRLGGIFSFVAKLFGDTVRRRAAISPFDKGNLQYGAGRKKEERRGFERTIRGSVLR